MKRTIQSTLTLLAACLVPASAWAQHSSGAGHAGGASHLAGPPSTAHSPGVAGHSAHDFSRPPGHWPYGVHGPRTDRGGNVRVRSRYLYGGYGLIPLGFGGYGLPYGADLEDESVDAVPPQAAPPPPPEEQEPSEMAETAPPLYRPVYQGPSSAAEVHPQPATKLIFNDGRAPLEVHNYALTATTLWALDGDSRREIPLSVLNVPATVAANHLAGVDFALPVSR